MTLLPDSRCDVLISGAGPVGTTLALALLGAGYSVRLVDRRPSSAQHADPRALALSHGARQLLEPLRGWPATQATPIETIHVSQRGGFGRTVMRSADYGLPALGYVVRYGALTAALAGALPESVRVERIESMTARDTAGGVEVMLSAGERTQSLTCSLLVHAEGTPTDDAALQIRDYGQHAIVCEAAIAGSHQRLAWERFTPDGPLALLPLGEAYSVVFTVPAQRADTLMAMDDKAFVAALQQQFGNRCRFVSAGYRSRFALALRQRKKLTEGRQVWIGNAAQTLHPVSGQGFNLGLRDAWQLAEALRGAGGDPGDPAVLAAYARSRMLDRAGGALFTDGIVRLFSNDLPGLSLARGLGLLALDLFPPARHFVARRMIFGARAWP